MSYFKRETDKLAKRASKTPDRTSQTTAYPSNTRKGLSPKTVDYAQNDTIKSLLERDYAFLPLSYREPGFLFRGLESGIEDSIRAGEFALNNGSHSLAALERELGVVLVSADFSDALSVSRLWESHDDGGIVVIPAGAFDEHYAAHNAAVLGFAEPGVVFKYPFFANPISVDQMAYLIIHQKQVDTLLNGFEKAAPVSGSPNSFRKGGVQTANDLSERLIVIDDDSSLTNRHDLNKYLNECLSDKRISKATSIQVEHYPKK